MTSQRFRRVRLSVLFGVAFCLLLGSNIWATSVVRLTDEGLVGLASVILEGKVTRAQSEWNADHTQIH